jgi:sterol desaturase/sphingolipid hydroxylase (fatty acid hydroxylase superfamily)
MTFSSLTVAFFVLTIVFWPLEGFCPAVPGQPRWRRDTPTDLVYWFFTPLVTGAVSRLALLVALLPVAVAMGVSLDKEHFRAFVEGGGRGPLWIQAALVLFLGDLIGYWSHRLFHGRRLWRFHSIHHSSKQVDWLSSVRLHPVNDVVSRVLQVVPFFFIGVRPAILAAYLPFLTLHAILLHANVSWTFGPLRYLVSSPAFHRWHHTSEAEGLGKNFAGLFPFIDLAFGTFYMPRGREPQAFGILGEEVPGSFLAQLAYPFRSPSGPG